MIKDFNGENFYFFNFLKNNNCVLFFYPKMGTSGSFLPENLKDKKGLTGCTLQSKNYTALKDKFDNLGYKVVAMSGQSPERQAKFRDELGVDLLFLNDEKFILEHDFDLLSFTTLDGFKFYHRQTLIVKKGEIIHRHDVEDPEDDANNTLRIIEQIESSL